MRKSPIKTTNHEIQMLPEAAGQFAEVHPSFSRHVLSSGVRAAEKKLLTVSTPIMLQFWWPVPESSFAPNRCF